jgi:hypothetical protein
MNFTQLICKFVSKQNCFIQFNYGKTPHRTVNVTRYITYCGKAVLCLRSEADDDFKYVLKFKGAGHGVKALIAELIGGEIVF